MGSSQCDPRCEFCARMHCICPLPGVQRAHHPNSLGQRLADEKRIAEQQRRAALATPAAVPVAWMHEDGRVLPASTIAAAQRDGGAMRSSLAGYTIPLYAGAVPAAPSVPAGWKVVPVEPTPAIRYALDADRPAEVRWRNALAAAAPTDG